jgi:hypothetical protein
MQNNPMQQAQMNSMQQVPNAEQPAPSSAPNMFKMQKGRSMFFHKY